MFTSMLANTIVQEMALTSRMEMTSEMQLFWTTSMLANTNCSGNGSELKNGNDFRNAIGETIYSTVTQNKNADSTRTQVVDAFSKSDTHLKELKRAS